LAVGSRQSAVGGRRSRLRTIIFRTFPGIKEEMKWGVPSYAEGKYYIVALKTHVNLGFSIKDLSI
jgi:hypothetical protein